MYIAFSGVGRLEDVSERKAAVSVLNVWSKRMYVCRCGGGGRGGGARSWREVSRGEGGVHGEVCPLPRRVSCSELLRAAPAGDSTLLRHCYHSLRRPGRVHTR